MPKSKQSTRSRRRNNPLSVPTAVVRRYTTRRAQQDQIQGSTTYATATEDGTVVLHTTSGRILLRPPKPQDSIKNEATELRPSSALPPPLSSLPDPLSAYHHLIPSISIAFSDGEYVPCSLSLPEHSPPRIGKHKRQRKPLSPKHTCTEHPFTHVLRILHPTSHVSYRNSKYLHSDPVPNQSCELVPGMTWCDIDRETEVHHLSLVVPFPETPAHQGPRRSSRISSDKLPVHHCGQEVSSVSRTVLTDGQMKLARDFLALALPCFAGSGDPAPDPVHVLITAPGVSPLPSMDMFHYTYGLNGMMTLADKRVRAQSVVDVMSVVACFEAYRNPTISVNNVLKMLKSGLMEDAKRATLHIPHAGCHRLRREDIQPWVGFPSEFSPQGVRTIKRGIHAQSVLSKDERLHIRM